MLREMLSVSSTPGCEVKVSYLHHCHPLAISYVPVPKYSLLLSHFDHHSCHCLHFLVKDTKFREAEGLTLTPCRVVEVWIEKHTLTSSQKGWGWHSPNLLVYTWSVPTWFPL